MNRSLAGGNALKSLGLTRNSVSDTFSVLLNHFIRSHQHIRRYGETNLLRRLEINHQLEQFLSFLVRTSHRRICQHLLAGQRGWKFLHDGPTRFISDENRQVK
jgi:hypothetical protein